MLELRAWRNLRRRRRAHNPAAFVGPGTRHARRAQGVVPGPRGVSWHATFATHVVAAALQWIRLIRPANSMLREPAMHNHGYVRYAGIHDVFATILQVRSIFHKLLYSKTSDILVGNSLQNAASIPYTELPTRLLVLLVESFHCLGSETPLSCSPASRVVRSVLVVTLYV